MSATGPRVRPMTADDLAAVRPLLGQLGYEVAGAELAHRYERVSGSEAHLLLVAVTGSAVTGFLHAFARPALEKPPEVIVQSMAVDETLRRSGVGRALIAAAEAWALDEGLASVALSSQLEREDAHAFYESLGYERVATSGLLRKKLG